MKEPRTEAGFEHRAVGTTMESSPKIPTVPLEEQPDSFLGAIPTVPRKLDDSFSSDEGETNVQSPMSPVEVGQRQTLVHSAAPANPAPEPVCRYLNLKWAETTALTRGKRLLPLSSRYH